MGLIDGIAGGMAKAANDFVAGLEKGSNKKPSLPTKAIAGKSGLSIGDRGADGNIYTKYNVFKKIHPVDFEPYVSGFSYVFFVTPLTSLNSRWAADTFNYDIDGIDIEIIQSLCYQLEVSDQVFEGTSSPFIKLLSNLAVGAPSVDTGLEPKDYAENFHGNKISFGSSVTSSRTTGDFSLRFRELSTLPVLRTIDYWVKYIDAAKNGRLGRWNSVAMKRVMDYMSTAYVFTTLPDGVTINYWAKYTGLYPTAVPWSSLNTEDNRSHDLVEVSIPFTYNYREEMDLAILTDFNKSADPKDSPLVGKYDSLFKPGARGSSPLGSNALGDHIPVGKRDSTDYSKNKEKVDLSHQHSTASSVKVCRFESQSSLGSSPSGKLKFFLKFD
jgi:hypothetical protein